MNSKRYIPLIVIGALILSLLAVIPAFGAGQVSFILPGDINDDNDGSLTDPTPDEQEWGRQGGEIGLMLEDDSLDVPVRRVLIPGVDATSVAENVAIKAHSATLTLAKDAVEEDDYVMVGDNNVRKVEKVETLVAETPTPSTADIIAKQGVATLTGGAVVAGDGKLEITFVGAGSNDKLSSVTVNPTLPVFLIYSHAPTINSELSAGGKATITIKLKGAKVPDAEPIAAKTDYEFTAVSSAGVTAKGTISIEVTAADSSGEMETVTLDTPFAESGTEDVYRIRAKADITKLEDVDWEDDYALYAMAVELENDQVTYRSPITRHDGDYRVVDSNIATTSDGDEGSALHRLTGSGTGSVNTSDALVVKVTTTDNSVTTTGYDVDDIRDARIEVEIKEATDVVPTLPTHKNRLGITKANVEAGTTKVYLAAWFEEPNDTGSAVSVRSQAYQTPTTVVLRETAPSSGQFTLKIETVKFGELADKGVKAPDLTADLPTLPVNPRDVITLSSPDSTETVTIETTKPVFTGLSPAHNTSGRASRPEVSAQVTDGDSGLTDTNIKVLFLVEEEGRGDKTLGKTPESTGDVDEISGGFEVTEQLSGSAETPDGDAKISWWVMATDDAGNVGFSDRVLSKAGVPNLCEATDATVTIDDDGDATGLDLLADLGCDPYVILVDDTDPELLRAETGRNWNSGLVTNGSDDKTEYRVSKAARDSILVVFDSHLDAETVTASDFEVNDSRPVDADVRNVTVRDDVFTMKVDPKDPVKMIVDEDSGTGNSAIAGHDVRDVRADRGYVFLTMPSDLTPNSRPKVELVGEVADLAGNNQNTGRDDDALDRIAPTLTVTIDEGDRPVTKDKINLTITSDENVGTPIVTFYEITTSSVDEDKQTVGDPSLGTVRFVSATEYKAEIDAGSAEEGLFTVYVTAADASGGNTGTVGDKSAPVDVDGTTTAILFENDDSIGDPDVDPDMDGIQDKFTIDDPNAFVRIDFSAEANEYDDGTYDRNVPATPATDVDDTRGDDFDTHASVTIVSATLGGMDIKDDLQSNDAGNVFLYKATGLAIGEHKLEVVATDEAGNVHPAPAEATITIIERKPYSLKLNPGWNLVSIPGEPAVSDINTVITYADNPDIVSVTTYDPSVPGFWLTATRGADNMFTGTLTNITSTRGYLIETTSFKPLAVNIPKQSLGAMLLPGISIVKGWNLVPILDVNGDFKLEFNTDGGKPTAEVNYFSGLTANDNAVGIYTFNTVTGSWTSVKPQDVEIGKAYWIYAEKEGVIIP